MKLIYFDKISNFGDVMNRTLFPALLPNLPWNGKDDCNFVGIGSILDQRLNHTGKTIVFGSGIRSPSTLPDLQRGSWDIRFVRGPLSARALKARFITDAAYAYALLQPPPDVLGPDIAFVPHYATAMEDGPIWQSICADLEISYIDPRAPFEEVCRNLRNCRLILSEAMHGAIFADLNRIPWIGFTARVTRREGDTNSLKWQDWAQSMDIVLERPALPVFWPRQNIVGHAKHRAKVYLARRRLAAMLRSQPFLSDDRQYQTRMAQLAEEIDALQRQYGERKLGA